MTIALATGQCLHNPRVALRHSLCVTRLFARRTTDRSLGLGIILYLFRLLTGSRRESR